jgi:hypothetical protein
MCDDVLTEVRPDWIRPTDDNWLPYTSFGKEMSVDGFQTLLGYDQDANMYILLTTPDGGKKVHLIGQILKRETFDANDLMCLQASFTIDVAEEDHQK